MQCSKCGCEIDGIMFTSPNTGLFICRKCFIGEIRGTSFERRLPERIRRMLALPAEGGQECGQDDAGAGIAAEDEGDCEEMGVADGREEDAETAQRAPGRAPKRRIERLYGVLFFKSLNKLDEAIEKIKRYYGTRVENLPINAPRQVDMDVRFSNRDGKPLWALVISAEIPVNGQDPAQYFSQFIEQVTGREPKEIGLALPERIRNMQLKRSHHIGHRRLSDFLPLGVD